MTSLVSFYFTRILIYKKVLRNFRLYIWWCIGAFPGTYIHLEDWKMKSYRFIPSFFHRTSAKKKVLWKFCLYIWWCFGAFPGTHIHQEDWKMLHIHQEDWKMAAIVPKRLGRKIDTEFREIHARYIKRQGPAGLGKMYTGMLERIHWVYRFKFYWFKLYYIYT